MSKLLRACVYRGHKHTWLQKDVSTRTTTNAKTRSELDSIAYISENPALFHIIIPADSTVY